MAPIEVSQAGFQAEVLERSETVAVVVDFWAPWCGRCRAFAPVLERAAADRGEGLVLAKVDTEANPALAGHYSVHGIPAVKAFRRRELVAQFVGTRSPAQVMRFLDGLGPSEIDDLVGRGDEASLRRAVELEPRRSDAAVPLARLLHDRGEDGEALEVLRPVGGAFRADALAARIGLAAATDPELGEAFAALDAGTTDRSLDLLLGVLGRAPADERAAVRQVILSLVDGLGFGHPLTGQVRGRLAAGHQGT